MILCLALGCSRSPLTIDASRPEEGSTSSGPRCDADGDGHDNISCGGDDCDDTDPARHPGALDLNVGAGPWKIEQASEGVDGDLRARPSLFVDASGGVHLSYVLAGLTYATRGNDGWIEIPIDPEAGRSSSIKLDPSGAAHIAYTSAGGLRYATNPGGAWSVTSIDPDGDGECSLALDTKGTVHVAYGAGDALRYTTNLSGSFGVIVFEQTGAASPSLALNEDAGSVHLSYGADGALRYGQLKGVLWESEVVAKGTQLSTSLALDAEGAPHITYADAGIRHATNAGGAWVSEMASDQGDGWSNSIAIDSSGAVHVAFTDIQAHYATKKKGAWDDESIKEGFSGGIALALDQGGAAHIAYSDFRFDVGTFVGYATNRIVEPDGIDQNCDGVDGVDADGDGHASRATGGDDCDDENPGGLCG